jgi:hypothetical protein
VLSRSRTLATLAVLAGEGPAVRGSAPLRGGRGRGHPLTACAPSGFLLPETGRRTGFCRSEQRTSVSGLCDVVAQMVVFLLAQMLVLIGLAGGVFEGCFFNRPRH